MKPSTNGNGRTARSPERNGHEERHEWQFRDQIIPAAICHKIQHIKNLGCSDLMLCFVVNSFIKAQTATGVGKGCYASDAYLADIVFLHPVNVNKRLHFLRDNGLLLIFYVKGKRCLETVWSRGVDELDDVEGEYGEALRKAWQEHKNAKGKPLSDLAKLSENAKTPVSDVAKSPLSENAKQSILIKSKENRKEKKPATPVVALFESPSIDKAKKRHRGRPVNPLCLDWAKRLKDACEIVKDCRLKGVDPILWSFQFDQVLEKYKGNVNRIETAVFGYLQAARSGKVDGQSWPTINCPEHFGNTLTWIENKLNETGPNGKITNRLKNEHFRAHGVL